MGEAKGAVKVKALNIANDDADASESSAGRSPVDQSSDSQAYHRAVSQLSGAASGGSKPSDRLLGEEADALRDSARRLSRLSPRRSYREVEQDIISQAQQMGSRESQAVFEAALGSPEPAARPASNLSAAKRRIFGNLSPSLKVTAAGVEIVRGETPGGSAEEIDEKQAELRDTIIKSFLVIFTHEESQHLLLNKDIIEIAFSCLENVFQISNEAKENLARLISIIFKFPQVQERLLNEGVILGIVFMLQLPDIHKSGILRHVMTACGYISLNFKFVNSKRSLHILQALMPILSALLTEQQQESSAVPTPPRSASAVGSDQPSPASSPKAAGGAEVHLDQRMTAQGTTPIDQRRERDGCIFAISNMLKGHPENARYFIQCDGARQVMLEVLRVQEIATGPGREIIELNMCCVKQVTGPKEVFRRFLAFSEENLNLLPACLEKCFAVSDAWHTCTSEILLFKKLFTDGEKHYEGEEPEVRALRYEREKKEKQLDSEQI